MPNTMLVVLARASEFGVEAEIRRRLNLGKGGKGKSGEDGIWRTIRGRRVFIREGESVQSALKRSLAGGDKKSSPQDQARAFLISQGVPSDKIVFKSIPYQKDVAVSYKNEAPVVLATKKYGNVLVDGHHRAVAAYLSGDKSVHALVYKTKEYAEEGAAPFKLLAIADAVGRVFEYNPNQPRDWHGRWADLGSTPLAEDGPPPKLHIDNPGGDWAQYQRDRSVTSGVTEWGYPRTWGDVTGSFSSPVLIPIDKLAAVPGMRGEQRNVREDSLRGLMDYMGKHGRLPRLTYTNEEYAPFIQITSEGVPWMNEGNHRVMAAKRLGWKFLPAEIRYFAGGEGRLGEWSPTALLAEDHRLRREQVKRFAYDPSAAQPRSLYVSRPVLNAQQIIDWAKAHGFETTLPAEDMHVTVCCSKEPVDWASVGVYAEWDPNEHPRGKTTPGSRGGSFAPAGDGNDPTKEFGTTDPYVYHLTDWKSVVAIQKFGLRPSKEGYSGPGIYFGNTPEATQYYKDLSSGALLRVSKGSLIKEHGLYRSGGKIEFDEHTGEIVIPKVPFISASQIEIRRGGSHKWEPLSAYKRNFTQEQDYAEAVDTLTIEGDERSVALLGDDGDAVVLKFTSPELQDRWRYFRRMGASWDYERYQPHITLSYEPPADLSGITPYAGPIVLGPEKYEEVQEGWAEDIEEHAEEGGVWRTIRGRRVFIREGEDLDSALKRSLAGNPKQPVLTWEEATKELWEEHGVVAMAPFVPPKRAAEVLSTVSEVLGSIKDTGPFMDEAFRQGSFGFGLKIMIEPGRFVYNETHKSSSLAYYALRSNTLHIAAGLTTKRAATLPKIGGDVIGSDFRTVLAHEIGHATSGKIALAASKAGHSLVGQALFESKPKAYWQKNVSLYAGTNHREMMAEAVAAYTHPGYGKTKGLPKEVVAVFESAGAKPGKRYSQIPSGINYVQIGKDLDGLEAQFRKELSGVLTTSRNVLLATVRRRNTDLDKIARDLTLPHEEDLRSVISDAIMRAWKAGGTAARAEVTAVKKHAVDDEGHQGVWRTINGTHVFIRGGEDIDQALARATSSSKSVPAFFGTADTVLAKVRKEGLSGPVFLTTSLENARQDARSAALPRNGRGVVLEVKVPVTELRSLRKGVAVPTKFSFTRQNGVPAEWLGQVVAAGQFAEDKEPGERTHLFYTALVIAAEEKEQQHSYATPSFTPTAAIKWLKTKSFWVTDVLVSGLTEDIRRIIIQGLRSGKPTQDVITDIAAAFIPYLGDLAAVTEGELLSAARLGTVVRTNTTDAYNHGRITQFVRPDMMPFLDALRYSAILDSRTTEVCRYLDGFLFKPDDPALYELLPPRHFNCRSIIVPVVVGEKFNKNDFIDPIQVDYAKSISGAGFAECLQGEAFEAREYYDPDQPRVPKGAEDGGQWVSTGVGQRFKDAPLDGKKAAAWRKKMQEAYDTDPEFRATADAVMLFTQGDYSSIRAMAQQEITGELTPHWQDSSLPGWRDKPMHGNALAKYKEFFKGQPFLGNDMPDSKTTWKEGTRALNNAIRTAPPLSVPIFRGVYGRDNMDKLLAMKPGQTFDMVGPTSFTADRAVAEKFSVNKARGQRGGGLAYGAQAAVIEVHSARGLPVAALSPWNQREVISSGRFRIKSIVDGPEVETGKSRGWTVKTKLKHVIVEQIDTFRNTKP